MRTFTSRTALHKTACCTKTARRAPVGSEGCERRLSAAEWGDRASRESGGRLGGDRFHRDPFMRQAESCRDFAGTLPGIVAHLVSLLVAWSTGGDPHANRHVCP